MTVELYYKWVTWIYRWDLSIKSIRKINTYSYFKKQETIFGDSLGSTSPQGVRFTRHLKKDHFLKQGSQPKSTLKYPEIVDERVGPVVINCSTIPKKVNMLIKAGS